MRDNTGFHISQAHERRFYDNSGRYGAVSGVRGDSVLITCTQGVFLNDEEVWRNSSCLIGEYTGDFTKIFVPANFWEGQAVGRYYFRHYFMYPQLIRVRDLPADVIESVKKLKTSPVAYYPRVS